MSFQVILTQMAIIVIFLAIGYFVRKTNRIQSLTIKDLSWVMINITSPAQILSSVLNTDNPPAKTGALEILALTGICYAILLPMGFAAGPLLRAKKSDYRFYNAMTVFGNTGFIGIPLGAAILGETGGFYMAITCLSFNLIFYTYGFVLLKKEGQEGSGISLKLIINPGTVTAVLSMIIFFLDIHFPHIVNQTVLYMSNSVTFFAIFIIGCNLADAPLRKMLTNRQMYAFVIFRQLFLPIILILIMKRFIADETILGTMAIFLSVPVANTPSMVATANGLDVTTITEVTVSTTLFSVITMTACLLVAAM